MANKYPPGPWKATEHDGGILIGAHGDRIGYHIASIPSRRSGPNEQDWAIAQLIVTAPRLVVALKRLLEADSDDALDDPDDDNYRAALDRKCLAIDVAHAVLNEL